MTLSAAATIVLTRAAERPDWLLEFHRKLPSAARHKMIDAMHRDGIIAETKGDYRLGDGAVLVENGSTGLMLTSLAITDAGFRALDIDPPASVSQTTATDAPRAPHAATDDALAQKADTASVANEAAPTAPAATPGPRLTVRVAAAGVLAAWNADLDRSAETIRAMERPMMALSVLLAARTARTIGNDGSGQPRKQRAGTKQEAVLTMLRRPEGATIAQVIEATGWASHTVRGFFAGLKKKGINVAVLERVRQVNPGKEGAKGSFSIYHVAAAA